MTDHSRTRQRPVEQLATIVEARKETADTRTLRLKPQIPFSWLPGQFITVRAEIDKKKVTRAYSISSSPTKTEWLEITVRQTASPTMSKYLNEVAEGTQLTIKGPYGRFLWTEEVSKQVILIGAGCGITPLKAIAEYILDKKLQARINLLYSCSRFDTVIFYKTLKEWKNSFPNFEFNLFITREKNTGQEGVFSGRIDKQRLEELIAGYEGAPVYICGSPSFVESMQSMLSDIGVDSRLVKREQWSG